MPRRTGFRIPGLRTWVDNIKNEVSKEAAEQIVQDLQILGPYWTGTFANSWVIRSGDVRINATTPQSGRRVITPDARSYKPVIAPEPKGRGNIYYTIGNTTDYRDIALDLDPRNVRWRGAEPPNTAPQDWYRGYLESGNLRETLKQVTGRVAQYGKIRGFRARETQP